VGALAHPLARSLEFELDLGQVLPLASLASQAPDERGPPGQVQSDANRQDKQAKSDWQLVLPLVFDLFDLRLALGPPEVRVEAEHETADAEVVENEASEQSHISRPR
jgi:hypothetical protein